jgi:hypothetical protein
MNFLTSLTPLFRAMEAIAAVLGVIIALIGILPSNQTFNYFKIIGAESMAPKGYKLIPSGLEIITENSKFIRGKGGSALLTSKEITFSVQHTYSDKAYVFLDGQRHLLMSGKNLPIKNTGCFLWLYDINQPENRGSFHVKCS